MDSQRKSWPKANWSEANERTNERTNDGTNERTNRSRGLLKFTVNYVQIKRDVMSSSQRSQTRIVSSLRRHYSAFACQFCHSDIHLSILIKVTSSHGYFLFFVAQVSSQCCIAGLTTVLYTFPFSFTGTFLSQNNPLAFYWMPRLLNQTYWCSFGSLSWCLRIFHLCLFIYPRFE